MQASQRLRSPALSSAILFAVCLLVHSPILWNGFVWDDNLLIPGTEVFRSASNLADFFTRPFWDHAYGFKLPYYRPMQPLLILLTSSVSGTHPLGYHLLSIVLQSAVAALFLRYALTLRVSTRAAVLAAAVFVLHPIHVEAVAFAACAPLLVSGACLMVVLLASQRLAAESEKTRENPRKRRLLLLGIAAAYLTALLSYDLALLIPVLVFLCDRLAPQRHATAKPTRVWLTEYALYGVLTLAYAAVRIAVLREAGALQFWEILDPNGVNVIYYGSTPERWLAPFNILSRAALLLLFPSALSPDYFFPAATFSQVGVAAFVAIGLLTTWCVQHGNGDKRVLALAVLWMILGALPALHPAGTFADRVFYLSSFGFALWLGLVLDSVWRAATRLGRPAAAIAAGAVAALLLALAVTTYQQTLVWRSRISLWEEVVRTSPLKPRAHRNLAAAYLADGQLEQASVAVERALALSPRYPAARKTQREVRRQMGLPDDRPRKQRSGPGGGD